MQDFKKFTKVRFADLLFGQMGQKERVQHDKPTTCEKDGVQDGGKALLVLERTWERNLIS